MAERQTKEAAMVADDSPRPRGAAPPRRHAAQSSRRRFSMHIAWTLVTRLLMTVNGVIAGIIVARWLGAEGLGQLAVINVAVATTVQLGSAGLPSANTYFIAGDHKYLAPAGLNSLVFALAAGSLLAFGLTVLAMLRPDLFGFISPRLIGIAAASIPFQLIALLGLNILLAVGRVERFNLLDLTRQSFVLINAVLALIVWHAGLWALVSLNTTASIIVGVLIIGLVGRYVAQQEGAPAWAVDLRLFSRMMRYGIKFHISILAGLLTFRADLLVVNHFRGAGEAGVYSVASQIAMMLMLLPGIIATVLFPRVVAEQDARGELACVVTRHTAFVMLFVCLGAVPLSFILPALYGAAFSDVTIQVLILLPGVYLIGLESVLVQHLNATGLPPAIPLFWVATLVTNIVLNFALVPAFGARGAALASTVSYALISGLVAFYFRAQTKRHLSEALLLSREELRALLTRRSGISSRRA